VKRNPEFEKKLRVERLKKLQFFDPSAQYKPQNALNDPNKPDFEKYQHLMEIDMLRKSKKEMIMNKIMGEYLEDS
jgi:hypothetical protein